MVKIQCLLLVIFVSFLGQTQNVDLGIGGNLLFHRLESSENVGFDVRDKNGDSLTLTMNAVEMTPIYSFPIFVRYEAKKNWWIQLAYGFEYWRIDVAGASVNSPSYLENNAVNAVEASWAAYEGTQFTSLAEYSAEFYPTFYNAEQEKSTTNFSYYDAIQYNKFSLSFGASLFNKSRYKVVYSLGLDFITKNTSESYHGLSYANTNIQNQFQITQSLPALAEFNLGTTFSIGIEKQNLRIGVDGHFFLNPATNSFEDSDPNIIVNTNNSFNPISSLASFGLHMNYTLFTHYFDSKFRQEQLEILDPKILAEHYEKPKKWRFGLSADFISLVNTTFTSVEEYDLSAEDHQKIDAFLVSNGDDYLTGLELKDHEIIDNFYIEKQQNLTEVNQNGQVDTTQFTQLIFFNWGVLNTIIKSPKLKGVVRFQPMESLSLETSLGFQSQTMGVETYEKSISETNGSKTVVIRELLYQEKFNEVSFGLQAYAHKRITNAIKVGFNGGVVLNHWIPGKFQKEFGGRNDSELLEEFHDYFISGDQSNEWNQTMNSNANKGVFSKQNYYDKYGNSTGSYHQDFSNHLLNSFSKRSFVEIRFGLDYYVEKWRFELYGEKSLWKNSVFYNNSFSLGISLSRYI